MIRGAKPELPSGVKNGSQQFRIPGAPGGRLDASSWRLPYGKALAEFALQAGFLAPPLFKAALFKAESLLSNSGSGLEEKTKRIEKEGDR